MVFWGFMDSILRHLFSLFLISTVLGGGRSHLRKITTLSAYGDSGGQQEHLEIESCTHQEQVEAPDGFNLGWSRLHMSTVLLCLSSKCIPCVRVNIKINNTVPVKIEGVQIHFFEYENNRNDEIEIQWRNHMQPINAADFIYECFESDAGSQVEVTVKTIPDYGPQLTEKYKVEDYNTGPELNYSVIPEEKQIIVTVPPGHVVTAMLCYKQALRCRELKNSVQLINTTSSLTYDYMLPCLCIEVFYPGPDSHRTTVCPFSEAPEALGPDLWKSSNFSDLVHRDNTMAVRFSGKCQIKPRVTLCWKSNGFCDEFEESEIEFVKSGYVFKNVDRHSRMCFKFKYKNSSHIECRNSPDADWNVTMVTEPNKLLLTFASNIPASFSAVLCKTVGNECRNLSLIYLITQIELSTQKPLMILPVESLEICVKVWRSDVTFSGKQLLCPHYSRQKIGLGLLGTLIVLAMVLLFVYMIWQFNTKVVSAPLWSRTVLLMYSPDSEEHKTLVCAFADILKTELHCNVILDLWDTGRVAEIGIIPWLYSKRELVETEEGKIIIIWSKRSQEMYNQWNMLEPVCGLNHSDLHDLFNTSMACVYNDFLRNRRINDYSIIYFDGLCSKENIPEIFTKVPKYRLLKDFSSLVRELQSASELPCSLKLGIKFLVRKILQSEKMQKLRNRIEQCRKLQRRGLLWCEECNCSD
ncbi:interleukin-17 receptor E-like isoform X1 [Heptranchias perlo]|uniref:interleukin-17 receptor E-like isoform X1 n=1 Tax=Heptranchias perlo TaxID=212740 RepID=UPI00355ACA8E